MPEPTPIPTGTDWRDAAVCRKAEPGLFYPAGSPLTVDRMTRKALALCGTCPVQRPCLEAALRRPEVHGIWGGTTEEERRARRRERTPYPRSA